MIYRLRLWLTANQNRIWITPALTVILAVALALSAKLITYYLPDSGVPTVSRDALDGLLTVLGSSMLAVVTFSLGIMVSAYAMASSGSTPRSTDLVVGDDSTRTTISAFIAAFIFAIVGKVAVGIEYYGELGRFILLVATVLVFAFVVIRLLLWFRTLTRLGLIEDTIFRISSVAAAALNRHVELPLLGAHQGPAQAPGGTLIYGNEVGYLARIDIGGLNATARRHDVFCHVRVRPGALIDPTIVLAVVVGNDTNAAVDKMRSSFIIKPTRTYNQDPAYGLTVLSEVAQRALSPAVNDPGTARRVILALTHLIVAAETRRRAVSDVSSRSPYDRVSLISLDVTSLLDESFAAIARDGRDDFEVMKHLLHALNSIRQSNPSLYDAPARRHAMIVISRAEQSELLAAELSDLRDLHRQLFSSTAAG